MSEPPTLTGTYTSPTNPSFTITQPLPPTPSTPSIAEKTASLAALRAAVTLAQAQINKELTSRMEDDKARDAASGNDVKEEENYGEEVQEDED